MIKTITLYTKPVPINAKFATFNGRSILTKRYRDAKTALALETRSQWTTEPLKGNITMNVMMYFGDRRQRDIDAHLKILLDSMEGIVYENDNQVVELHCFKEIDIKKGRTIVQIL